MEKSFSIAEEILPGYGFDKSNLEEIIKLIRNSFTGNLESPSDFILHDAKYDYMGRVDFIKLTDKLLREESEYGKAHSRKEWIEIQRQLLIDNEFVTNTAKLLRSVSLEDQIGNLQVYNE
jgi:hypothetical protein